MAAATEAPETEAPASAADERPTVIEVDRLVAHYPGNPDPVLKGISLEVREGEIFVIMGGSGSGKSTLLRHLLALEKPTSGSVRILGDDIHKLHGEAKQRLRRRVGVAFQGGALLNSLTVAENLKLPLREHTKLAEAQMDIIARMKLAAVNLDFATLRRLPAELSGGMLKRAALARAIMMDPKVLLADEPSAGLDPAVSATIDDLILRLRDAVCTTIVVITHERHSAFKLADRIAMLDRGEILEVGSLDELRQSPNMRIQNLLDGVPEPTELQSWLAADD